MFADERGFLEYGGVGYVKKKESIIYYYFDRRLLDCDGWIVHKSPAAINDTSPASVSFDWEILSPSLSFSDYSYRLNLFHFLPRRIEWINYFYSYSYYYCTI